MGVSSGRPWGGGERWGHSPARADLGGCAEVQGVGTSAMLISLGVCLCVYIDAVDI